MTIPDLVYLALIALLMAFDHFVLWPTFLRRSDADAGRARLWLWSGWMMVIWVLTGFGTALWMFDGRAWEALRFTAPHGWRLWVAIGLVLALVAAYAPPILRFSGTRRPKRVKFGSVAVERLVPHTRAELGWWVAVSLSAGFCEEFIFRGYLIWAFQPAFGLWGAAVFSVVVFAAGHAYQGVKGIVASGTIGAVLTLLVLGLGSLWPAIILHALLDIGQGLIGWLVLRAVPGESGGAGSIGESA